MSDIILEIKNLEKKFIINKNEIKVLENINIDIKKGEFITIVGHSGCGKSTLLKIIAGLETSDSGIIRLNGQEIKGPGINRGVVFQEHRLLPWLTIKENIEFGLDNLLKKERENISLELLEMVNLLEYKNAYPKQLSGGMAQRVAIARGLASNPEILLLDEPFGALDALTRIKMQKEILKIWSKSNKTMIMITHDIEEAVYLGTRIVILSSKSAGEKIIKVEHPIRDRSSYDFLYIKNKVYRELFEDKNNEFILDVLINLLAKDFDKIKNLFKSRMIYLLKDISNK